MSYGPYNMTLKDMKWKPWKGFGGYQTTADPVKLTENRYGCDFFGFFDDEHDLTFQVQIKGTIFGHGNRFLNNQFQMRLLKYKKLKSSGDIRRIVQFG